MVDPIEAELLAMLQEPSAVTEQRKQIAGDIAMQKMGLALAPLINARLAHLAETISRNAEPLPPEFQDAIFDDVENLYED